MMSDSLEMTDKPMGEVAQIAPKVEEKRGPGRPAGTTKSHHKKVDPLTPEPPPRSKKDPADVKDPYAAINRCHREMAAHVANLRDKHPESEVSDPVNPLDVKKDKLGAPMDKTAFHGPIRGLCGIAGWIGNLPPEEMPTQEQYDHCAEDWARGSRHLGWSEKTAALFSAFSSTGWLFVSTAAKSVKRLFGTEQNKDEQLKPAGVSGPAEVPTGPKAPLSDDRTPLPPPEEAKKKNEDLDNESYR